MLFSNIFYVNRLQYIAMLFSIIFDVNKLQYIVMLFSIIFYVNYKFKTMCTNITPEHI